ncbi:MAG: SDR family NAD(P)-dependent oxidoreductase, partial [Planctomycetaceae bacterium]
LHTRHGCRTEIIPCDLAEPGQARWLMQQIAERGLQVELLVNNAGFAHVGDVEHTDPNRIRRLVELNIATLTDLTYAVLPDMLKRRHGAVINVSSLAAFQPVAYMAAYAASKSYVLHFSEALWAEVRDRGVTVLGLCPGVTDTEFFTTAGIPNWLAKHSSQPPAKVVKRAIKALEKRKQYVIPRWRDYLLSLAVRFTTRRTAVNEARKYFKPKPPKDGSQPAASSSVEKSELSKQEAAEAPPSPSDKSA